jgi:hypothetical protein
MKVQLITGHSQGKKRGFAQPHLGAALEVITSRAKPLLFLEYNMKVNIKGYELKIDTSDLALASEHGWCVLESKDGSRVYFHRSRGDDRQFFHRLITGAKKGQIVDHINRNTLDNRRKNLRLTNQSFNLKNSVKHKDNSSGLKGVVWNEDCHKWAAYICHNYKKKYLGVFQSKSKAHEAYKIAAIKIAGEFARW